MAPNCIECGSEGDILFHHLSYEYDITVPLCQDCHQIVHSDGPHSLSPIDERPSDGKQVKLPDPVYDKAKELKDAEEFSSLGDAIRHVFVEAGYDV